MTDDLIERLHSCEYVAYYDGEPGIVADEKLLHEAANRIEELQADNAKLREALGWFLNDSRFVVQVGGNPYAVQQMIEDAREALQETGQ